MRMNIRRYSRRLRITVTDRRSRVMYLNVKDIPRDYENMEIVVKRLCHTRRTFRTSEKSRSCTTYTLILIIRLLHSSAKIEAYLAT